MQTKIKTENPTRQTIDAGLNLGGPTFDPLDTANIDVNLSAWKDWANRYEQLNGGA